ncbi:MAG: UDP-2,3-diacylglucosamine diphosphatase [Muribaculaceae bacterium]|nr:UDP-2,3-diacylglucosamine diphosphatase [Muribaculaceae bacterium]
MNGRTKTYFISDLHLGAAYLDRPHDRERMLAEFLNKISADAARLYLVGDVLDYWFEYRTVVPRGHVRFFGALAALADSGVEITWLIGNHDIWMFDYLRNELGIKIVDDSIKETIDGKNFFISHGDGLGKLKPSFRFIRSLFRSRVCQKLYAAIHPRWTVAFAYRWSSGSRHYHPENIPVYDGEIKSNVGNWARDYISTHPDTDYIVIGHHHVAVDETLDCGAHLIILGDWIYNFTYAVFDGKSLRLEQYERAKEEFNTNSRLQN